MKKAVNVINKATNELLVGREIYWNPRYSYGTKNCILKGWILGIQIGKSGMEAVVEITDNSKTKHTQKHFKEGQVAIVSFDGNGNNGVWLGEALI
jgi:hypothetical protein